MLRVLFLTVIALYLLSTLLPQWNIDSLLSILCFFIVVLTFRLTKKFVQILGGVFLTFGAVLLWTSSSEWQQYIFAFGPMLDLLTMFTLIPILGIPVKLGRYGEGIQAIIQKRVKTSGHLYMMTSGISYFFSIFMNLATLPMTYYSIRPALGSFPVRNKERFMSRAISRGFAMPLIWAPVTPIVGIVITMTGVSWGSILPYVIPLSILGLAMDWFIGSRQSQPMKLPHSADESVHETASALEVTNDSRPGRVFQILVAIAIFNVLVSFAETQVSLPFLILVSLIVIPFSFSWSLLLRNGKEFGHQLSDHFNSFAMSMKDQFFIFLSTGFFISAINISKANEILFDWIAAFISMAGVEIFLIILPLIPLGLAFLGLHPAVSLALMIEGVNPEAIGISPHILTVAMLSGAVSAFLVGPYNATLGLMSNIIKVDSYKVSSWNLPFAAVYVACVMFYLFMLERLL
ncbi:MAG: hypothetical protein ACQEXE_04095 [Bacillota bacterium]|uniref:hypothetical protein n=1 Tax=Bacillaceae TaxID=186817 RepID=UPI0013D4A184|nr:MULTISPECIES: hypothetical protein [Bacillaceae]MCS0652534.1 hypothetical protein [Cytobacillus firmus]WHY36123.1 hypothetical protein QNH44_10350 [Cytobacillus firmus]